MPLSSPSHPPRRGAWTLSREACWSLCTKHLKMVSTSTKTQNFVFDFISCYQCCFLAHSHLAGITLSTAAGTQTGVYVGCFTSDYNDITIKDLDSPSKYAATGTEASMLSNRVSWFFDFRGPSMTIDTACSSSLVAAHEACMSLKLREISMVRMILSKSITY